MTTQEKNNPYKDVLERYGLDKKEADLYLSALELGESNMSVLAKKAGIKRSSAYLIFKTLEQKGLMGSFKMKNGLKFVATRPEILLSKAKSQLQELEQIIPQLNSIAKKADYKPKITYYEGIEGYKIITEDSLKERNTVLRHIGSISELHKIIGVKYDLEYYIPTRIKGNNFLRAIYPADSFSSKIMQTSRPEDLRELRVLPEKYLHNTSTLIYGNKVAITSTQKELFTIMIESEEIAASEKAKFDLIWDLLGK